MVHLAFYKYSKNKPFYKTLNHRIVNFWTNGKYSHAEVVFNMDFENMIGFSASSSQQDGGVVMRPIKFNPERWDFIEIDCDETSVLNWFIERVGKKYDYLSWLGFVLRPIKGNGKKYFCSEAICESLNIKDAWRYDPNSLYSIAHIIRKKNNAV